MKISKEEKSLYNFLNVFNTIFGKSEYRNTIVGKGNRCYFFTNGYIGIFEDKDRETLTGGNYDFGQSFYELKQTPAKTFVLDEIEVMDNIYAESIEKSIELADQFYNCNSFKLEYDKQYEYKLAKIAEETGRWLKDQDVKYLDKFKEAKIFQLEDSVIVKSSGLTKEDCSNVTTILVFVGEIHPDLSDATQQKMNVDEPMLVENKQMLIENHSLEDIVEDDPYPDNLQSESFDEDGGGIYF